MCKKYFVLMLVAFIQLFAILSLAQSNPINFTHNGTPIKGIFDVIPFSLRGYLARDIYGNSTQADKQLALEVLGRGVASFIHSNPDLTNLSTAVTSGKVEIKVRDLSAGTSMAVSDPDVNGVITLFVARDFLASPVIFKGVVIDKTSGVSTAAINLSLFGSTLAHELQHVSWNINQMPKVYLDVPVDAYDVWRSDEALGAYAAAAKSLSEINKFLSSGSPEAAAIIFNSTSFSRSYYNTLNMTSEIRESITGRSSVDTNAAPILINSLNEIKTQISTGQSPYLIDTGVIEVKYVPASQEGRGVDGFSLGFKNTGDVSNPLAALRVDKVELERFCSCSLPSSMSTQVRDNLVNYLSWGAPIVKTVSDGIRNKTIFGDGTNNSISLDAVKNRINIELKKNGKELISEAPNGPWTNEPGPENSFTEVAGASGQQIQESVLSDLASMDPNLFESNYISVGHSLLASAKFQTSVLSGQLPISLQLSSDAKELSKLKPSTLGNEDFMAQESDRISGQTTILDQLALGQWSGDGTALGASTAGAMPTLDSSRAATLLAAAQRSGSSLQLVIDSDGKKYYLIKLPPSLGGVTIRVPTEG